MKTLKFNVSLVVLFFATLASAQHKLWEDRVMSRAEEFAQKRDAIENVYCSSNSESCGAGSLTAEAGALLDESCNKLLSEAQAGLAAGDNHAAAAQAYQNTSSPTSKAFLRAFDNTIKVFVDQKCGSRFNRFINGGRDAKECFEKLNKLESDRNDFLNVCRSQVNALAFTPAEDNGRAIWENVIDTAKRIAERAWGNSHFTGNNETFTNENGQTCTDANNCFFTSSGEETNCDLLDCSLAVGQTFAKDKSFSSLFGHMVNRSKSFQLRGNTSFCNNCLGKVYEQAKPEGEAQSFEEKKKALEGKLQDNLASKIASKKILNWIGHLESLKNLNYLEPNVKTDPDKATCSQELKGVLLSKKSPCQGVSDEQFQARRKNALGLIGIPYNRKSMDVLLTDINQAIDPQENGNSCRKGYALKQQTTLNSFTNQKYKDVMDFLITGTQNDEELNAEIEKNCSSNDNKESFHEVLALGYGKHFIEKFYEARIANPRKKLNEIVGVLCEGEDPLSSALACGKSDSQAGINPEVAGFFNEMGKNLLFSIEDHGMVPEVKDVTPVGLINFQQKISKAQRFALAMFKKNLEMVFLQSMKQDPRYKAALGSWKNVCDLKKKAQREGKTVSELVDRASEDDMEKNFEHYASESCGQFQEEITKALCETPTLNPTKENKAPYSQDDLTVAKDEMFKFLDGHDRVVANSISCEQDFNARHNYRFFNWKSTSILGRGLPMELSDYEQIRAAQKVRGETGVQHAAAPTQFEEYRAKTGCESEYLSNLAKMQSGDTENINLKENPSQEKALREVVTIREERQIAASVTDAVAPMIVVDTEGLVEERRVVGNIESLSDSLGKIDFDLTGNAGISSNQGGENSIGKNGTDEGGLIGNGGGRSPSSIGDADIVVEKQIGTPDESIDNKTGPSDDDTFAQDSANQPEKPSQFQNLFGFMSDDESTQTAVTAATGVPSSVPLGTSDYFNQNGSVENEDEEKVCEGECLEELAKADSKAIKPEEAAAKAGITNYPTSTEEMKKMFGEVLDGKLNNTELAKLQEENEKLREEMQAIRTQISENAKPAKVLDSNGVDRTESVSQPEQNPNVVFNPRNKEVSEFRSRSYFDDKKEEFSPSYSDGQAPERISLGNYSEQRRAASVRLPVEQIRKFNGDIDRTFLQAHSSSQVDDTFIKQYVEHVDQNSGSIEHLIVYENGRPARIRVPDPKNPGDYVEKPIAESLVQEILEKVEKDELESFALYNMVNFGQSLDQFMQALESEETNLTTLSSLNKRLEEMRDLEN